MQVVSRSSILWDYLSPDLRGLIEDGEHLLDDVEENKGRISDYSYLVFPFSKAYEGFLKQLFLDLDLLREDEYYGEDIRIGRILNPNYMAENTSLYKNLCLHSKGGEEFTKRLWKVWRKGRNQVFHYFPHNFRRLSLNESLEIIHEILSAMENAVGKCELVDVRRSGSSKKKSRVAS
jgi:hypothetical protein